MTARELRAIRRELQLTQAKLAEAMGVTRETVARWETGSPIPLMAQKLLTFLRLLKQVR